MRKWLVIGVDLTFHLTLLSTFGTEIEAYNAVRAFCAEGKARVYTDYLILSGRRLFVPFGGGEPVE